jgi:hypothetical protein
MTVLLFLLFAAAAEAVWHHSQVPYRGGRHVP